jgi:hypothetical protein
MKIGLHDNGLGLRGTTVALYDYAYYLKYYYNIECVILYNIRHSSNNMDVVNKFLKEFQVFSYSNIDEIDIILSRENCDCFFMIKSGEYDGVISKICTNLVMAVSANISKKDIHGDKYFVCSKWLSELTGIDYVPHMINLPNVNSDMREELNIPLGAIVMGRNGGNETFDLNFVKDAIRDVLNIRDDIYFLFQNTDKFIEHERVIYLNPSANMDDKVRFINSCDAHIHARNIGESFGLTCGEFSIKNKKIITWNGSRERNHIEILGNNALLYINYNDIYNIFLNYKKEVELNENNCYNEYNPEKVMDKFKKMYL